jgi:hypothetical protein
MTAFDTFTDNMTKLVNAVTALPAEDEDAKRILHRMEEWSDGMFDGEKKLLLAAVQKRSMFTLDVIAWVSHVTTLLGAASLAPAASEHVKDELEKSATWLVSVLDWTPEDEGDGEVRPRPSLHQSPL